MKDFTCCEITLPTLHDLLQHYEEAHADMRPEHNPLQYTQPQASGPPDTRAAIAAAAATNVQQQAQKEQKNYSMSTIAQPTGSQPLTNTFRIPRHAQQHPHFKSGEFTRTTLQPVQDMDSVEDMEMEMDDVANSNLGTDFGTSIQTPNQYQMQEKSQLLPRSRFGQPASARLPPLDLNALNFSNPLQMHQGLRQSQPSTPVSGGRPSALYQNNPTVSSVNTPTLSAHPLQQQFRQTPDSSAPGTPGELDPEFLGTVGNMSVDNAQQFMPAQQQDFSGFGFGNGNEMLDLCIDEPAKRLFRTNGGVHNQQQVQARLGGNAQYSADSELARRIREQQRKVGLADTVSGLNGEEPKPFRCPVIGCEKAYKNQNGLKYHKTVRISFLFAKISSRLTNHSCSTAITTKPSTKTWTELSPSSIRLLYLRILVRWGWRKRNHTSAMFAANVTRISTVLNTTSRTHRPAIPIRSLRQASRSIPTGSTSTSLDSASPVSKKKCYNDHPPNIATY